MDNEDVIRNQMEDTRTSLSEKLETLEKKVASTVESATSEVAQTVEAVKESVQETVATVKNTVQDTISVVKDSVKGSVDAVQGVFDIPGHVQRHPWGIMAGSVALGFFLGSLGQSRREEERHETPSPAAGGHTAASTGSHSHHRSHKNGRNRLSQTAKESSSFLSDLAPELNKLKGLAIGTLLGSVREMVVPSVPESFGKPLAEFFGSVTTKLGGTPINSDSTEEEERSGDFGSRLSEAH